MDRHKIENYVREGKQEGFPPYLPMGSDETTRLRTRWIERLGLGLDCTALSILESIRARGRDLAEDAGRDGFDLRLLLGQEGIQGDAQVVLNWDRFQTLDQMKLSDISRYWEYLWYPSVDDLEIFGDNWVLSIHHSGQITFLKF